MLPVLRWILKHPNDVVPAVIAMGPIAEDETIKLLSEKDPDARLHAARILMDIGTRKSLQPLLRLSKDMRHPGARAMGQQAYDAVKARVDAERANTASEPN